jgi:DNA-binding response OmpR family regulator
MWLVSEVGDGSTFGFSIPTRRASDEIQPDGEGEASASIVVIEDDRASSDLLTAYLSGVALRVTTARDGQSGLDAVRRDRPSAVLLDIRLPGVDGWTVLQQLKSEAETKDIPVIVVSIVDERSRGAAMGTAAYMVKPVSRDDLLSALAAVGIPVPTAGAPSVGEA